MAITIEQLADDRAVVRIRVGQEVVTIEYFRGRLMEDALAEMQDYCTCSDGSIASFACLVNKHLVALVANWDIYQDSAWTLKLPIDLSSMNLISLPFRYLMLKSIVADAFPTEHQAHMQIWQFPEGGVKWQ